MYIEHEPKGLWHSFTCNVLCNGSEENVILIPPSRNRQPLVRIDKSYKHSTPPE